MKNKENEEEIKWRTYILRSPNGREYIGQTCKELEKRWNNGKGYTKNKELNADIEKYGWENFEKIPCDEYDTLEEAAAAEVAMIEEHGGVNSGKLYNIETGGVKGYTVSEACKQMHREMAADPEYRKAMSERAKKLYEERPELKVKISQSFKKTISQDPDYSKKLSERGKKYYEDHPEAREAMSEKMKKRAKEHPELIQQHTEHMKKLYAENPEMAANQSARMKELYADPEFYAKMAKILKDKAARKVKQFTKEGVFVKEYDSITDAAAAVGVTTGAIEAAVNERANLIAGFFWRYSEGKINPIFEIPHNGRYVYQLNPVSNEIIAEYESCRDAARALNCKNVINSSKNIAFAASHGKISQGYKWQYVDDYKKEHSQNDNDEYLYQ